MEDLKADAIRRRAMELAEQFKNMPPCSEMGTFYDNIDPEVYNDLLDLVNFTEKNEIVKQVYSPEGLALTKDCRILDVGFGTGKIGEMLHKQGYTNIDGVDASQKFTEHVRTKDWYQQVDTLFLGVGVDQFPDKFKRKYDCACASGVFMPNHMPPSAMDDVHASLKTGGSFVTAMRANLYVQGEEHGYYDKIHSLIDSGKFKMVKTGQFTRGYKDGNSLFAEQPSVYLVLERID